MTQSNETAVEEKKGEKPTSPTQSVYEMEKESWDAWWKVMDIETRGNVLKRFRYLAWRAFDFPVTWIRENIVDPLHARNKWPYYHRRFNRVRSIDECEVGDFVCWHEANWQYRLEKLVDTQILNVLQNRFNKCRDIYDQDDNNMKCGKYLNDFEEADLNYFIKYGEMGVHTDAVTAYMKQKHRMIWERRHPRIMQERERAFQEHQENMKKGIFDQWFWKRGYMWQMKNYSAPLFRTENQETFGNITRENVSQDPLYFKEKKETGRKENWEGHTPFESFP